LSFRLPAGAVLCLFKQAGKECLPALIFSSEKQHFCAQYPVTGCGSEALLRTHAWLQQALHRARLTSIRSLP